MAATKQTATAKPKKLTKQDRRGAPSLYSKELVAAILQDISIGVPIKWACAANGLSYDAWNDWENGNGGIPKEDIDQFRQSIQRAKADSVKSRVVLIQAAAIGDPKKPGSGDWRAASWYLEHVHSEDFAKREIKDHQGTITTQVLEVEGITTLG